VSARPSSVLRAHEVRPAFQKAVTVAVRRMATHPPRQWPWGVRQDQACPTEQHHDCVCDICTGKRPCNCGRHE
jgi:hypothetical protein